MCKYSTHFIFSNKMSKLHRVFVYGTLKRGEPNHHWFSKSGNAVANFLCEAQTETKFPLIIGTKYNIPFLLYNPGTGYNVQGELYDVDDATLANLDILEDHPNYYVREEHSIITLDENRSSTSAWIYFLKNFKHDLLQKQMFESYSNNGTHGLKYAERYQRNDLYDHVSAVKIKK